jgi:hypothetical protein
MAEHHIRTTPVPTAKIARQSKPKSNVPTHAIDSNAVQRMLNDTITAEPSVVLTMQRIAGNRAVSRLIQAKLNVGPAGDRYEQEADRVAQQVLSMPAPGQSQATLQRAPEEDEEVQMKPLAASITPLVQRASEKEEEDLQMKPDVQRASSGTGFEVSGDFEQQLSASRGGGSPLPDDIRSFMEPRFGSDFSGVRIHAGNESAQLNRSVQAQAFTHGSDIYLGEGKSDLESAEGKQLLAHELTHVVQQTGHVARRIQRLWTADELLVKGGKPKSNVLFHKMSTKYKKILAEVGSYDDYLSPLPRLRSSVGKSYADGGKECLNRVQLASQTYLAAHKPTQKRASVIRDLVNQIGPEKGALDKVAANYDAVKDIPGRAALEAAKQVALTTPPPLPSRPMGVGSPAPQKPLPPLPTGVGSPAPQKPLPPLPTGVGSPAPQRPLPPPRAPQRPLPPLPTLLTQAPKQGFKPSQAGLTAPAMTIPTVPTPPVSTPVAPPPLSSDDYMKNINSGGFKWLSKPAEGMATQPVDPGLLATPGKGYTNLSEAEITAIRVYTAADYMYINPALAGSEGYLKNSLKPTKGEVKGGWGPARLAEMQDRLTKDPKGLLEEMGKEGLQHSAMAIQGLKKLPTFKGKLKRGERWTEQVYKERYQKGKVDVRPSFTSVSKNPDKAGEFAGQAEHPERGVVLDLDIKDGREINELSVYYNSSGGEEEVLLLPGAELTVNKVDDPAVNTSGVLNVELEQTK